MDPNPALLELASTSESGPLELLTQRLSVPNQRASEHCLMVALLRKSIAWDEERLTALDDEVTKEAKPGRVIHGAADVSQSLRETIAHNSTLVRYHEQLQRRYESAARQPWVPVEPDPPEPE